VATDEVHEVQRLLESMHTKGQREAVTDASSSCSKDYTSRSDTVSLPHTVFKQQESSDERSAQEKDSLDRFRAHGSCLKSGREIDAARCALQLALPSMESQG
jgi:hypothetical protein